MSSFDLGKEVFWESLSVLEIETPSFIFSNITKMVKAFTRDHKATLLDFNIKPKLVRRLEAVLEGRKLRYSDFS